MKEDFIGHIIYPKKQFDGSDELNRYFDKELQRINTHEELIKDISLRKTGVDYFPEENPSEWAGEAQSFNGYSPSYTPLRNIPFGIFQLLGLRKLDAGENHISDLPAELSNLIHLETLLLDNNNFTDLPSIILSLKSLKILDMSKNQIAEIPAEIDDSSHIQELRLANNRIKQIPEGLKNLKNLKVLDLRGNSLPMPIEILEKINDPYSILSYYFSNPNKKRAISECKLILVGESSVGKTSLAKQIVSQPFDERENKTDGIVIQHWQVTAQDFPPIKVNIWDFGGQEIMHATHQFFLTNRSVYILVLDSRLSQEENRTEYWLKLIRSFGGDSPIVVVGNKIDQQPLDIDRQGLQNKYPNIINFIETSCSNQVFRLNSERFPGFGEPALIQTGWTG